MKVSESTYHEAITEDSAPDWSQACLPLVGIAHAGIIRDLSVRVVEGDVLLSQRELKTSQDEHDEVQEETESCFGHGEQASTSVRLRHSASRRAQADANWRGEEEEEKGKRWGEERKKKEKKRKK